MKYFRIFLLVATLSMSVDSKAQQAGETVETEMSSRPQVWWHWLNGNITREGIYKDLTWMHRAGIGGVHVFDAGMATPQVVKKRLTYMSEGWKEAFAYAAHIADSLGMTMAISSSPGWSLMGGPWVTADDAMKKLTWRYIDVKGSGRIDLPKPFSTTGPFLNAPWTPNLLLGETYPNVMPSKYQDVCVIAVPLKDNDHSLADLQANVTCQGKPLSRSCLTDNDLSSHVTIPVDEKTGTAVVDIIFDKPQKIRSLCLTSGRLRAEFDALPPDYPCQLEVKTSAGTWRKVMDIPTGGAALQTVDVPETEGQQFRVVFERKPVDPIAMMLGKNVAPSNTIDISELNLFTSTRVNHSEEKTGFMATYDVNDFPTTTYPDEQFPDIEDVIDLTSKVQYDGTLLWEAPKGHWRIYRFGWSLTGIRNHPASPEGTGLEIDKLDKNAWQRYFRTYLNMYKEASNGLMGNHGVQYLMIDSYESGSTTWTPSMPEEFQKRRGYSLIPWLPALAGQVMVSAKATDKFLWDWRQTISELIAENYDGLNNILKEYGMKGRFTESHEHGRLYLVDGMDVKRKAAVPMSAFWAKAPETPDNYFDVMAAADIRESASVAHVYGQNVVAAESFTTVGYPDNAYNFSPENLKPYADFAFSQGVNQIVVHTSPHQPVDSLKPGLSLSAVGQWYDRHETWAEQAKVWNDYLARTSNMLRKGHFVADIAYYYGEDNNISARFGHKGPGIPQGYDYDYVNANSLLHHLYADNGQLVSKSGMRYKLLIVDTHSPYMSDSVKAKLDQLQKDGICIYWIGKEKGGLSERLRDIRICPDVVFNVSGKEKLRFVHRSSDNKAVYWISNPYHHAVSCKVSLRISGLKPILYQPEEDEMSQVSYEMKNGRTDVFLHLDPMEAVFIVLSDSTSEHSFNLPQEMTTVINDSISNWTVHFPTEKPRDIRMNKLVSWTSINDPDIKYFSGTATYTTKTDITRKVLKEYDEICLDLGNVKNIAEISVNGQVVDTLWKTPFITNIKPYLKRGENIITVNVTNLWANRLIGDLQPDNKRRHAFSSMPFYKPSSPLLESGIIGRISLIGRK